VYAVGKGSGAAPSSSRRGPQTWGTSGLPSYPCWSRRCGHAESAGSVGFLLAGQDAVDGNAWVRPVSIIAVAILSATASEVRADQLRVQRSFANSDGRFQFVPTDASRTIWTLWDRRTGEARYVIRDAAKDWWTTPSCGAPEIPTKPGLSAAWSEASNTRFGACRGPTR
jgi:hypothetical protein